MLLVSVAVCLVIGWLLWRGARRFKASGGAAETRSIEVADGPSGLSWIRTGLLLSGIPLLIALVWTMATLAAVSGPPAKPDLTLDVTGHQWWWEVSYASKRPAEVFTTANEIHVPVGAKVLVRLHGADVIHSFWVPKLTGKTDVIPGQTNLSWLEAREPGIYRGPCTEYCGVQHAHMMLEVVAQSPAEFEAWRQGQLRPAVPAADTTAQHGQELFEYRCGLCHAVRGTRAGAHSAPDLTHLASRRTIAAGLLPNTAGTLSGWVENAQGIKPGNLMPNQDLPAEQLSAVVAYLETLR
jgi:cytochrome c oxidase subunit 2